MHFFYSSLVLLLSEEVIGVIENTSETRMSAKKLKILVDCESKIEKTDVSRPQNCYENIFCVLGAVQSAFIIPL